MISPRHKPTRICRTCGDEKPNTSEHWAKLVYKKDARELISWCVKCKNEYYKLRQRELKLTDPKRYHEIRRRALLKKKFGMTLAQYALAVRRQNFRCALCGAHIKTLKKGLNVDHCHKMNRPRALLCGSCNKH
jgi:hypothetical protein